MNVHMSRFSYKKWGLADAFGRGARAEAVGRLLRSPWFLVLLFFTLVDLWPLARLGERTQPRVWELAGAAFGLGASLAVWRWRRLLSRRSRPRVSIWILAGIVPVVLVGAAPTGVQFVSGAAIEGFLCAIVLQLVRAQLLLARLRVENDRRDSA